MFRNESDSSNHLSESATKFLMTALISTYEPEGKVWLNPKEELVSPDETTSYIISTLKELKITSETFNCEDKNNRSKISKYEYGDDVHSEGVNENFFNCKNIVPVEKSSILELYSKKHESIPKQLECDHEITVEKIIDCFAHPDVIKLVCKLLKEI